MYPKIDQMRLTEISPPPYPTLSPVGNQGSEKVL